MKSSKPAIYRGIHKPRIKKFSKHWLEAVKLSDLSVMAASGEEESNSNAGGGGEIYYQVPGYSPITGVGAYVSPWNTNNAASNPPVFNYSECFIVLVAGGHFGILSIEQLAGGNWRTVAALDGQTLIATPYYYNGSNHTYLEIDVDSSGNWNFWADFGSVGGNHGSIAPYSQSYAQFGCSSGPGDYLMYNAFSNCGVNFGSAGGWRAAEFYAAPLINTARYQAVGTTADSVLFQDSPPY